jgi:hypothetical protein
LSLSPGAASYMTRVDFFCSHRHYVDHLLPVYAELPRHLRGEFHVGEWPANPERLTVVASYGDYARTEGPAILFEHGVGFTFDGNHQSYAGGPGRERVVLFCSPNEFAAAPNRAAYPDTPQEIVGCPKLDAWTRREWSMPQRPTVGFSFHWDCHVQPETRSAFPHYQSFFTNMGHYTRRRQRVGGWDMIGHGHPRYFEFLRKQWSKSGITPVREFSDVVGLADVYVCDASSTIYEFAALGRPVVVLNAPWYRRDVQQGQGLRFWNHIPGIQVEGPHELRAAIDEACFNDSYAAERERITRLVYPHLGESTEKAASAIQQLLA